MTESGRERAKIQAVHEYLYGHASVEDQFGQGFDKGWQAAFEAGRGGWISVEERLPDEGQSVLAWFVDDNSAIGGERREDAQVWKYSPRDTYFPRRSGVRQGVTHWLSLPAPPDSGDKGVGRG